MITPWYDLKSGLAKQLGKTLIKWSRNMHSHPGEYTADEWQALLYMHGCTLVRYGKNRIVGDASNYAMVTLDKPRDNGMNWELELTCPDGFFIFEDDVAAVEAKASLQWVTDHFHTLWD